MVNDESVHVEYDTTGVPSPMGSGEHNYSKNLSNYFYNKMNTISNSGDFNNYEITLYGLEVTNDKINISTTKKLINYLKSLIKKNAANINTNLEKKVDVDDIDNELKDSSNPISNSAVFNKFSEVATTITNNYNFLVGKINELTSELGNKANSIHNHSMSDVTNLNNTITGINNSLSEKATNSSFNNHINNRNNPHGVTLEQLGFADSGWITFPVYTGSGSTLTHYDTNSYLIQYRKYGKIVEIRGTAKTKQALTSDRTGWLLGYLPEGFRPSKPVRAVNNGSGVNRHLMFVGTDGIVQLGERYGNSGYNDIPKDAWLNCYITFLVD